MSNSKYRLMILATTLIIVLFTAVGCGTGTKYTDGKYEGVSNVGKNPNLTVEVNVVDGKIADVTVTSHNETPGVGTPAIDNIPSKIVEAQSTDVEAVTGATYTSNAIIEAVNIALDKAK